MVLLLAVAGAVRFLLGRMTAVAFAVAGMVRFLLGRMTVVPSGMVMPVLAVPVP